MLRRVTAMRIGVDLGGTKIEVIALDEAGAALVRQRVNTPIGNYSATLSAVAGLVASVEKQLASFSIRTGRCNICERS